MKIRIINIGVLGLLGAVFSCSSNYPKEKMTHELPAEFGEYWYQGKAELANYHLQQVRYGEIREGHTVLIFVTEDFSRSKQVKLDNPSNNERDVLKVMKLNATRKFNTGIDPYSTMTSIFTPVYLNGNRKSVKLTTTTQEWCGHTFLQANQKGSDYQIQSNSYFESEGDAQYDVSGVLMEDEIWTRIRLNPNELPIGNIEILPGSLYCRFKHVEFKPEKAQAELIVKDDNTLVYSLKYPNLERTLKIRFGEEFPFKIQGWEETYPEGGQLMTTRATRKEIMELDYWNKNENADEYLRSELGLE